MSVDTTRSGASAVGPAAEPYAALAAGYDAVMAHVEYDVWADHVQRILDRYRPGARSVVELGCGTGALAAELQPLGPDPDGYAYRGYDGAPAMAAVARARAAATGLRATFDVLDFRDAVPRPPVDVVVLLYDGLNYLLDVADVSVLFERIAAALLPGGIAVVDQSTPVNSVRHADDFDDAGETGAFRYVRTSRYDPATMLHTTRFELAYPDGRTESETHLQRAYGLAEIREVIAASPLTEVAALHEFTLRRAGPASERVHWVLRRADDPPPPGMRARP